MEILETRVYNGETLIGSWVQDTDGYVTANVHYGRETDCATARVLTSERLHCEASDLSGYVRRLIQDKYTRLAHLAKAAPRSIRDNINTFDT